MLQLADIPVHSPSWYTCPTGGRSPVGSSEHFHRRWPPSRFALWSNCPSISLRGAKDERRDKGAGPWWGVRRCPCRRDPALSSACRYLCSDSGLGALRRHHSPKKYITQKFPLNPSCSESPISRHLDTRAHLPSNTSPPLHHPPFLSHRSYIAPNAKMTSAIVTPLKCPEGSKIDFGATVSGVDIENLKGKTVK